jgi:hypothetical protein
MSPAAERVAALAAALVPDRADAHDSYVQRHLLTTRSCVGVMPSALVVAP